MDRDDSASGKTRVATQHGFTALRSGLRLGDRYTIEAIIAAGGFGITYVARHDGLDRVYAIKEHFPRQFAYRDGATLEVRPTDPQVFRWALDRFLEEGRSLARCKHPNIVDVTDVFEANGTAYMVLVYEEGQSLASWLKELARPPTQVEMDQLVDPLLDALGFVHANGLLHRDIAPDNIMVRRDGSPCLIDFGAARQAVAQRSRVMSTIVKTGFSPPEQYTTSGKAQGPWSDIYALGGTLYKCITGEVPPEATERVSDDELVPALVRLGASGSFRPGFLSGIDAALRLKQAERPQSAAAWRADLFAVPPTGLAPRLDEAVAEPAMGRETPPAASTFATRMRDLARRPSREIKATVAAIFAIALLAMGMSAAGFWPGSSRQPALPPQSSRPLPVPVEVEASRNAAAAAQRAAAEAAQRTAAEAAKSKAAEAAQREALAIQRVESEQRALKEKADAEQRQAAQAEAVRQRAEEAEKVRREEAEKRRADDAETRRAAEAEKQKAADIEASQQSDAQRRRTEEAETRKAAAEAEKRQAAETAARKKAAEQQRRAVEIEAQKKIDARERQAEERRKAAAAEQQRQAAAKPAKEPVKEVVKERAAKSCGCSDVCDKPSFYGWINRQLCEQCRAKC